MSLAASALPNDPVSARLAEIGHEFDHTFSLELSRIEAALEALSRPQDRVPPVFHVAGTNGKGSVCAFLRAITEEAARRAHVFTSPHLIRPNERIRVAGKLVGDAQFISALDKIAATGALVTYFEAITAAAFLLFAETPADAVILETGLGGRVDATNIFPKPAAAIVTPRGQQLDVFDLADDHAAQLHRSVLHHVAGVREVDRDGLASAERDLAHQHQQRERPEERGQHQRAYFEFETALVHSGDATRWFPSVR